MIAGLSAANAVGLDAGEDVVNFDEVVRFAVATNPQHIGGLAKCLVVVGLDIYYQPDVAASYLSCG